jgi:hypothetical protein
MARRRRLKMNDMNRMEKVKRDGGACFYFDKDGFFFDGREENREPVTNFSSLWEEL